MDTQQYVLTVTNEQGGCISTDTMYVYIGTAPLNIGATASPYALCLGESTQLHVDAGGGSGDFSYSWSPTDYLNSSNISNPVATPQHTITYTCYVTDKHVISVQTDRGTPYNIYFQVQNELVAAYNELRDDLAIAKFGHPYIRCSEDEQVAIRTYYPQKISEAEPKNYGGN